MNSARKILVPTDFSVRSLMLVPETIEKAKNERIEILLLHAIVQSSSITDLLFFSEAQFLKTAQSDEFTDACRLIQNKYDQQLKSIYPRIFIGNNQSNFNKFLNANKIEEAIIMNKFEMNFKSKQSFDPSNLLKKSQVKLNEIQWHQSTAITHQPTGSLSDLFFSRIITAQK